MNVLKDKDFWSCLLKSIIYTMIAIGSILILGYILGHIVVFLIGFLRPYMTPNVLFGMFIGAHIIMFVGLGTKICYDTKKSKN